MATPLRPLNTGELLDRTFSLYRNHFMLFFGVAALPCLILLAYTLAGLAIRPNAPQSMNTLLWTSLWGLGTMVVSVLATAAAQAATVIAVSQVHLERPAGVVEAFSLVSPRLLTVVGLSIVIGIAVVIGFVFLIVPGVLLILIWSLAIPIAVLENKGVGDSLSRSYQLTQGGRGRIFVIWLLFIVLRFAIAALLQWPIIFGIAALTRSGNASGLIMGLQVVSAVITFATESLVSPLVTVAFALVYYDQRVRKEAFDLQWMMSTLDANQLPATPA
jgi:hypothetical protein